MYSFWRCVNNKIHYNNKEVMYIKIEGGIAPVLSLCVSLHYYTRRPLTCIHTPLLFIMLGPCNDNLSGLPLQALPSMLPVRSFDCFGFIHTCIPRARQPAAQWWRQEKLSFNREHITRNNISGSTSENALSELPIVCRSAGHSSTHRHLVTWLAGWLAFPALV